MNAEPEESDIDRSPEAPAGDQSGSDQPIVERIHFLFRQAGDNLPALELAQQVMIYRLQGRQP